ncbi:hypothetical protein HPB51_029563 [Rhipicephalus microplus]|uniref:Uncharacterized protein n=1 Tax=Rhipicephalus microplus TaxID=6941 RepID=A0A9J6CUF0_RHIMP|nr:hypothetical protein HPB51_029563 [Rhipicephalus microplus]
MRRERLKEVVTLWMLKVRGKKLALAIVVRRSLRKLMRRGVGVRETEASARSSVLDGGSRVDVALTWMVSPTNLRSDGRTGVDMLQPPAILHRRLRISIHPPLVLDKPDWPIWLLLVQYHRSGPHLTSISVTVPLGLDDLRSVALLGISEQLLSSANLVFLVRNGRSFSSLMVVALDVVRVLEPVMFMSQASQLIIQLADAGSVLHGNLLEITHISR